MELNTEINKVFGQEMAKIFASTISDEEMMEQARSVWRRMTSVPSDSWNRRSDTELERYIKDEFLKDIQGKIKEILAEPRNAEELEKRAREMVDDARRIGEETIIKAMAEQMAKNTLFAYNVDEVIYEKVMRIMQVEKSQLMGR